MRRTLAAFVIGLAAPAPASAQLIYLHIPDIDGDVSAQVVAPRNYLEQIRNGTLHQLELLLPAGAVNDAIAKINEGSKRLNSLTARVPQGNAAYLEVKMTNVMVSSYSLGSSGAAGDKWGRVKIQFYWDRSGTEGHMEIGALEAGSVDAPEPATFNGGILWVNDTGIAFNVIAPANFLSQLRDGTLRALSLQLAPGRLNDQLAQDYRTRSTLASVRLKVNDGTSGEMEFMLYRVRVTSYSVNASAGRPPKLTLAWGRMMSVIP